MIRALTARAHPAPSSSLGAGGTLDGDVTITGDLTVQGTTTSTVNQTVSGTVTITAADASALTVGRQGATDPVLKINSATASQVTGISITGAASGGDVAVAAIGGSNESLLIDALGSGDIVLQSVATGKVGIGTASPGGFLSIDSDGSADSMEFTRSGQETYGLLHGTSGLFWKLNSVLKWAIDQTHHILFYNDAGTEYVRLQGINDSILLRTTTLGSGGEGVLAIANGTQGAAAADMIQITSEDLSAGNTILSIRTEGSGAVAAGTPAAADGAIAMKVNGTVRYLTYSDTAPT